MVKIIWKIVSERKKCVQFNLDWRITIQFFNWEILTYDIISIISVDKYFIGVKENLKITTDVI